MVNQAYLIDQISFAKSIFSEGYLSVVEQIIQKAVELLVLPASLESSKTLYREIIEQSYINLEELVHFLEADSTELKELTCSKLV